MAPTSPKILTLDIETMPNTAYVWGLWNENIPLIRLRESVEMLCYAYKWLDEGHVHYFGNSSGKDRKRMVRHIHGVLDEADIVVTYNGKKFDIPHLSREFLEAGLAPPAPYKQVDLYQVVKQNFKFPSNKLEYVLKTLGLQEKVEHAGFEMWVHYKRGDKYAEQAMMEYCTGDVIATEQLYKRLLPWINHPSVTLLTDVAKPRCHRCGSEKIQFRGTANTAVRSYRRWQCQDCKGWGKSGRSVNTVDLRGI